MRVSQLEEARKKDFDAVQAARADNKCDLGDEELEHVNSERSSNPQVTHAHRLVVKARAPPENEPRANTFMSSPEGYRYLQQFVPRRELWDVQMHNCRWLMDHLNDTIGHVGFSSYAKLMDY